MVSPQVGSATDRSSHTATLVRSNGLLVIIGGVSAGALVPMSEILVYDTTVGVWSVQTATGATPPLRRNHVAVASKLLSFGFFYIVNRPHLANAHLRHTFSCITASTGQIYIHGGTDIGAASFFADVAILGKE